MPHRVRKHYDDVAALIPQFNRMAAEAGRPLEEVPVTIWGAKQELDPLLRDRDLGVQRVVVSLESAKAEVILPQLDRWAGLIPQVA
jgi:hypothetical protein